MKRNVTITADGSTTLEVEGWREHYHSTHGAIAEAYHVFIKNGLLLFQEKPVAILEIGLGVGLNTFITFLEHTKYNQTIYYQAVEAYPVNEEQAFAMNYPEVLNAEQYVDIYKKIHTCNWEQTTELSPTFTLCKRCQFFEEITDFQSFNLIYFDAFGARVQPELWTVQIFQKMYNALKSGGVLVTYSAKGSVRRAMLEVGFEVEKLAGPPNKREMLRATKP